MITQSDFIAWKDEPLTRAWFEACMERIEEAKEILSVQAGTDQLMDNFYRGFIYAYREMMDFRIDEEGANLN